MQPPVGGSPTPFGQAILRRVPAILTRLIAVPMLNWCDWDGHCTRGERERGAKSRGSYVELGARYTAKCARNHVLRRKSVVLHSSSGRLPESRSPHSCQSSIDALRHHLHLQNLSPPTIQLVLPLPPHKNGQWECCYCSHAEVALSMYMRPGEHLT